MCSAWLRQGVRDSRDLAYLRSAIKPAQGDDIDEARKAESLKPYVAHIRDADVRAMAEVSMSQDAER